MKKPRIKAGDWIVVTAHDIDGIDQHYEHTLGKPKYLYQLGSGGKVIYVDSGVPLVEFHWGKYNYQQDQYKEQPIYHNIQGAKGGWFVDPYCLTVLPKDLTIKEMKALAKVMI